MSMIIKIITFSLSVFCFIYSVSTYHYTDALGKLRTARVKSEIADRLQTYDEMKHPFMAKFERHHSIHHLESMKYWRLGDKDKALSLMNKSVEENPYNRQSWYELGQIYAKMEDNENAAMSFLQALDLYRDDVDSSIGLLKVAIQLNDKFLFEIASIYYKNKLFPSFQNHYKDDYLVSNNYKVKQNWRVQCIHIDTFQSLLENWEQMRTRSIHK